MPSDTITHLIGGGLAGLISDGVVHPIDTVRARLMISAPGESQSATRCMLNIFKQEGVGSLYKGFSAVALGTFPGHALYFAGYEFAKKHLNAAFNVPDDSSFLVHFASGFFADVCGALTWTPMDVVKQRLQVQRQHTSALRIGKYGCGEEDCEAGWAQGAVQGDGLWTAHLRTLCVPVLCNLRANKNFRGLETLRLSGHGTTVLRLFDWGCTCWFSLCGNYMSLGCDQNENSGPDEGTRFQPAQIQECVAGTQVGGQGGRLCGINVWDTTTSAMDGRGNNCHNGCMYVVGSMVEQLT